MEESLSHKVYYHYGKATEHRHTLLQGQHAYAWNEMPAATPVVCIWDGGRVGGPPRFNGSSLNAGS